MKTLLIALFVALALPAAAAAHATLVTTQPPDGAVLARAPAAVRITFDDTITRGPGNEAIRNGGSSVLAAGARVIGDRTLVLPLRRGLADGPYTVRWAIVSDDGHLESGVLAFAVGLGQSSPTAALTAEATGPQAPSVIARWLFLAGTLAAVGMALFTLVTRAPGENVALVLASAAVLTALGGADTSHRVGLHTRAGLALVAGSAYAVVVALVAASGLLERRALRPASWLALPLVAVPAVSGHALDRGLARINVPADILHVAGAAAWVGALLGLVLTRRRELRLALAGVVLLTATGIVRASYELLHATQLWGTGYGRSLLVKTGLLVVALALGIRQRPRIELAIVGGLVVTVAILGLQRPGRNVPPPGHAPIPAALQPPPPPPPAHAIVVAREAGPYGVALEAERRRLTVVVLSPAGGGASGLDVSIDGARASACGHGCYRVERVRGTHITVVADGYDAAFDVPLVATRADAMLREIGRAFRAHRSVELVERLASSPANVLTSRWLLESPNRLTYSIRGGAQAIVVGGRRWDRGTPRARWVESPQTPLPQPATPWRTATNVWRISTHDLVFVDPTIPAFFDLELHERLTEVRMVAAAHFMIDRYVSFDSAPPIRPPRRGGAR